MNTEITTNTIARELLYRLSLEAPVGVLPDAVTERPFALFYSPWTRDTGWPEILHSAPQRMISAVVPYELGDLVIDIEAWSTKYAKAIVKELLAKLGTDRMAATYELAMPQGADCKAMTCYVGICLRVLVVYSIETDEATLRADIGYAPRAAQ